MGFNFNVNSLRGNTSMSDVDKTMYSTSVVDSAISVCSLLNNE